MTITKNGLEYRATSLEDIAAEFDRLAQVELNASLRSAATGGATEAGFKLCAKTWQYAAAILRATKLEPAKLDKIFGFDVVEDDSLPPHSFKIVSPAASAVGKLASLPYAPPWPTAEELKQSPFVSRHEVVAVTTQNTEACNHQWVTTAEGTAPCPKCGTPCPD